jgi:lambda repressor-like predicted transcriptional regulator
MHPADITAALKKRGSSQSEIARSVVGRRGHGVTPGAVYLVVKGLTKSRSIASRISAVTGIPVAELWPGKYPDLEKFERVAKTNPAFHREVLKGAADLARGKAVVPTTTKRRAA